MRLALIAAAIVWPGVVSAEAAFLGPLLDSLGNPERSAAELENTLKTAGFAITGTEIVGPEILTGPLEDPYYFHFSAYAAPGPTLAADSRPEMALKCSRIGQTTRNVIETGNSFVPAVQTWSSVVDFAPGAAAQLKCVVDLLPLEGTVLPTTDEVLAAVQQRFAESGILAGKAPWPESSAGWAIDPPEPKPQAVPELFIGQTRIAGRNPATSASGIPDSIFYDHFQTDFMHSFTITGHIALPGS